MAFTVSRIIQDATDALAAADITLGPNQYLLDTFNSVNEQLTLDCQLLPTSTLVQIPVVASQAIYTVDPTIKRIWSAYWQQSAGSNEFVLIPTSQDRLDEEQPGWRDTQYFTAQSGYYYNDGGNVGIYPLPQTSAVGGYPSLNLYVTKIPTLGPEDSLPSNVSRYEAWTYGICQLYAARHAPQKYQFFQQLASHEKMLLAKMVNGLLVRTKPTIRVFRGRIRSH